MCILVEFCNVIILKVMKEQQWKKTLKHVKIIQTKQHYDGIVLITNFIMLILGV